VGGYAGVLDDGGETVRLVRPDQPPPDEPLYTPFLLVDEVPYDDAAPWPTSPDGSGAALARISLIEYGREPSNWEGRGPTPAGFAFAQVVGRSIFYNNSAFDGNNPAANVQDDAAIAPDKSALLPGGTATFANYTSYTKGINGILIDVADLALPPDLDDFTFRTGNNNALASWVPVAAPPVITLRPGEGAGGSDRIALTWPDGTITKRWLQVTLHAGLGTTLLADDVFYFGNAVGESGDSTTNAAVNAIDEIGARANPRNALVTPAPLTFLWDYNRDKAVNATDQIIARTNTTSIATRLGPEVPGPISVAPPSWPASFRRWS
jgi:hypothetical protein